MNRKERTYRSENKHHSQNIQNTGNKLQCHNYKGISLKCKEYQILTTVINNRLKKYTDEVMVNTRQDSSQENQLLMKFSVRIW
jgi:hypothetical protein